MHLQHGNAFWHLWHNLSVPRPAAFDAANTARPPATFPAALTAATLAATFFAAARVPATSHHTTTLAAT